jgi:hypothetical protein
MSFLNIESNHDFGLPDYGAQNIPPYRGFQYQGVKTHPVNLRQSQIWYRRLFKQLGWALLRQEEGDTQAVQEYLHSLQKLDLAMQQLRQRLGQSGQRPELQYGIGLRIAKLRVLEHTAQQLFSDMQNLE